MADASDSAVGAVLQRDGSCSPTFQRSYGLLRQSIVRSIESCWQYISPSAIFIISSKAGSSLSLLIINPWRSPCPPTQTDSPPVKLATSINLQLTFDTWAVELIQWVTPSPGQQSAVSRCHHLKSSTLRQWQQHKSATRRLYPGSSLHRHLWNLRQCHTSRLQYLFVTWAQVHLARLCQPAFVAQCSTLSTLLLTLAFGKLGNWLHLATPGHRYSTVNLQYPGCKVRPTPRRHRRAATSLPRILLSVDLVHALARSIHHGWHHGRNGTHNNDNDESAISQLQRYITPSLDGTRPQHMRP